MLDQSVAGYTKVNLQFLTDARKNISFTNSRAGAALSPVTHNTKKPQQPTFYLDTNIMVDVLKDRNADSSKLINLIDKNKWKCVTSAFAFMEMIDAVQDHKYAKIKFQAREDYARICRSRLSRDMTLSDLQSTEFDFRGFHQQYPFICPVSLDATGWDLALHIASSSNIFAPDVVHLITAWICGCDLLITNDSHFAKESKKLLDRENIRSFAVCPADNAEKTMQEMGFEVTAQH